jgi:hypothetical protein
MALYDPWSSDVGFRLDEPTLGLTLTQVGSAGWVARLVCRAFIVASATDAKDVRASSLNSIERIRLARSVSNWVEPENWCDFAAKNGHLKVLQWARANGCDWTHWTCDWAAKNGHLEVLQWARANGCDWSSDTCALAASNGHLEVLKWAQANGCKCRVIGRLKTGIWRCCNGLAPTVVLNKNS